MSDLSQSQQAMDIIDQARKALGPNPVGEHGPPGGTPPDQGVPEGAPPAPTPAAEPEQQPQPETPRQDPEGAEVQGGEQQVPYDRFKKVNSERKALVDANAKLVEEAATLRKQLEERDIKTKIAELASSMDNTKDGEEAKPPSTEALVELVEKMVELKSPSSQTPEAGAAEVAAKWKLMENEGLTLPQAGAVYDYQQKAPDLPVEDVVFLVQKHNPELFSEAGSSEDSPPVPGSHSVSPPRSTGQKAAKPPDKTEELRQKMLSLPRGVKTSREQQRAALDFLASLTGR